MGGAAGDGGYYTRDRNRRFGVGAAGVGGYYSGDLNSRC